MAYSITGMLEKGKMVSIPLDKHPEHAAALGRLLGHWAFLETQLIGALQCLLFTGREKARFVWQEFISAKGKIELAQRLNFHFTQDVSLKDELDDFLKQAQTLNGVRNKYVHALWGDPDPGGNTRTLMRISNTMSDYKNSTNKHEPFTPEAIQDDAVKIATLSQCLSDWQARFVAKFGAPL
jgi:hypothetical protein